ncbi:MAG TPA: hypothetical protein VFK02_15160 [Kofleriaceae bacterium]|nr:hypothetical protein [Kofleriaceae bacterium]
MNRKALITTLAVLASSSSVALAHPTTRSSASAGVSAHVAWDVGVPAGTYRNYGNYGTYRTPAPIVVRDHRAAYVPPAPRYREDITWTADPGYYPREARGRLLADGLTYNAGEYRKDIVLEGRGRFNLLKVIGDEGCSFIKEVRIEYIGGAVQSIPVNQNLEASEEMTFDLDGSNRAINRIFVYRADGNNMNIGFHSAGEFSVVGL